MFPGCLCEACVSRWIGDIAAYAARREQAGLEVQRLLEGGNRDLTYRVVRAAALEAAWVLADEARKMKAAAERRAGRPT